MRWLTFSCFIVAAFWATEAHAMSVDWGGQLRAQGSMSNYDSSHVLRLIDDSDAFFDVAGDLRLNASMAFNEQLAFAVSYEAAISGGQTREALSTLPPEVALTQTLISPAPSDAQQFFSLTRVFSEKSGYIAYHRIDRLWLAYQSSLGTLKFGRQALTWGNGLIFNPADLINPFAPTDVIRDYKVGTDMALFLRSGDWLSDLQVVYVPRRDLDSGDISASASAFGAKARFNFWNTDWDLLAVQNYDDTVLGLGASGYLGDAVWRSDVTYTFLDDHTNQSGFVAAVANLDYSWVWGGKNWYGFIEFYYNGLGDNDPVTALRDPALVERLLRGEIFVTGRWYFDGMLQFEAHPLVNIYTSLIFNLGDGSFILQPRLTWDAAESFQVLAGINWPVGRSGTEFGEISDSGTGLSIGPPTSIYVVLTYYF